MTAWTNIVNNLNNLEESSEPIQVNKEQYEAWKKEAHLMGSVDYDTDRVFVIALA